jgi:hypothetical protein
MRCAPAKNVEALMPLFFFHLRSESESILDPEGVELDADVVASKALWHARDCIAGDVKDGSLDLRFHIDVHDRSGAKVHSLAFADAVDIIR